MTVSAESVFLAALAPGFTGVRLSTKVPGDLGTLIGAGAKVVRVQRFGGLDESISTFDNASVDFDCFAANYSDASDLAYAIRAYVRDTLPGQRFDGTTILRTASIAAPVWAPWDNTTVQRFTYAVSARLHYR